MLKQINEELKTMQGEIDAYQAAKTNFPHFAQYYTGRIDGINAAIIFLSTFRENHFT
jgi:hypothetical protein